MAEIEENLDPKKDIAEDKALYYTKDGRSLLGSVPPTAYAWNYPWPPCPSDLNKNKVYRPDEQEAKEVVNGIQEEFQKVAKPLKVSQIGGKPVNRRMVPEIELALYWDRHPYEFRPPSNLNRAKSAANVSSLGDLIQVDHIHNHTRVCRSGSCGSSDSRNKRSRSSSASVISRKNSSSRKNSASGNDNNRTVSNDNPTDNHPNEITNSHHGQSNYNHKSKSTSPADSKSSEQQSGNRNQPISNSNPRMPKILQVLSQNEKRKFDEIKRVQSATNNHSHTGSKAVRDTSRINPNSVGVQATLDDVTSAALKSTYLCPLHGQFRQGIDRRAKSGFRTDLSSVNVNPHARCSRGRTKTKLVKSAECQTENGSVTSAYSKRNDSSNLKMKKPRSKTAGANQKRRGNTPANNNMLSEYHGNYRHPGHIAESENRRLRNKILSYCFTKHSIF